MNRDRRDKLSDILVDLEAAKSDLEEIIDEEQEAFDNLPDNLQCSSRGEEMESGLDELRESFEKLEEVIEHINNVVEV